MRGNLAQEELFGELRSLKSLLKKLGNIADGKPIAADKTASRQSENLKPLVVAGNEFYTEASSTASTDFGWKEKEDVDTPAPYSHKPLSNRPGAPSSWVGSQPGNIDDEGRRRIEEWGKKQPSFAPGMSMPLD